MKVTTTVQIFSILAVHFFGMHVIAQNTNKEKEIKGFIPSGKPIGRIFSNLHVRHVDGQTSQAFDLKRAYLGYKYNFSENYSAKVIFDVGSPDVKIGDSLRGKTNQDYTAYVKNASFSYHYENLRFDFGLISTRQFKRQESFWGYRYIYKSFQDEEGFESSADFGTSVSYQLNQYIMADVAVYNGAGYKSKDADGLFKYVAGLTHTPMSNMIIGGYYDIMGDMVFHQTFTFFAGYSGKLFCVGAEYATQENSKMRKGHDYSGFSAYTTWKLADQWKGFARYDYLESVHLEGQPEGWNEKNDGQTMMGGLEFNPVKGVKIAPNFRYVAPFHQADATTSVFLNLELRL